VGVSSRARSLQQHTDQDRASRFIELHKGMRMKTLTLSLLAAVLIALSGCNTVEGAGKDVKATGQAVEKAADKAKTY
jgi:predicted small secreted protein